MVGTMEHKVVKDVRRLTCLESIVRSMSFGRVSSQQESCNHLMRIISTYVGNTKKSEIS